MYGFNSVFVSWWRINQVLVLAYTVLHFGHVRLGECCVTNQLREYSLLWRSHQQKMGWSPITIKPRANGPKIVGQQLLTLLDITCCVRLHTMLHVVGSCCAKSVELKPVKLLSTCKRTHQLSTLLALRAMKFYLHVANVLVVGEALGESSVGLILWADTRVPIIKKKTRGSNAPGVGSFDTGQVISVKKQKPSRWFFAYCIGFEKITNL